VLQDGEKFIESDEIIEYLTSEKSVDLDKNFTPEEKADIFAFVSMIETKLYFIMLFNWWSDPNYLTVTKDLISSFIPFPLNLVAPFFHQKRIKNQLSQLNYTDSMEVYQQADECYTALSKKLGNKPYFFGNRPSSLDAVVYGHLAAQYYAPMKECELHTYLHNYSNLCSFVERISAEQYNSRPDYKGSEEIVNKKLRQRDLRWKTIVITGGIGIGMWLFVYSRQLKINLW